jgi:hypothetical protein
MSLALIKFDKGKKSVRFFVLFKVKANTRWKRAFKFVIETRQNCSYAVNKAN